MNYAYPPEDEQSRYRPSVILHSVEVIVQLLGQASVENEMPLS